MPLAPARCPGPPGRLSAISVFLCKSVFYGVFVWARRALNIEKWRFPARAVAVNSTPFGGNYPTGVFTSNKWRGKDVWYYGTMAAMGGNASKWNENCKVAWCAMGPFPGWLWSDDRGQSWHNSGHFPQGYTLSPQQGDGQRISVATGGLFGECKGHRVAGGHTSPGRVCH